MNVDYCIKIINYIIDFEFLFINYVFFPFKGFLEENGWNLSLFTQNFNLGADVTVFKPGLRGSKGDVAS